MASDIPSPENLEDLYENAPCGYMSLRPDGRIVKSNATLSAWLGYAQDEMIGRKLHDLLTVAGKIFYETHFAPLLRMQGFFDEVALDFVAKDAAKIPVLANALERRGPAGELLFTRIAIFKAEHRRRHERELVEARAAADAAKNELQAVNATLETRVRLAVAERLRVEQSLHLERETAELREQFIAILGHDLRNPLASFTAGVRLLRKAELGAREQRILDLMQGSALRMSGLIDNVLDFARARLGGGLNLDIEAQEDLQSVIEHVVAELRTGSPDAAIETEFGLSIPVACDRVRIGQLVSNLVGNAVTHGAAGQPVRLRAVTEQGEFVLSVVNCGAPIPEKAKDRLFQPFVRGEVRGSRQGLGLGLYIASEIAMAHGGALTVASDSTETRFTFKMPLPNGGTLMPSDAI